MLHCIHCGWSGQLPADNIRIPCPACGSRFLGLGTWEDAAAHRRKTEAVVTRGGWV